MHSLANTLETHQCVGSELHGPLVLITVYTAAAGVAGVYCIMHDREPRKVLMQIWRSKAVGVNVSSGKG